jgi:predicted GIY-YIG superfamily endonuclease
MLASLPAWSFESETPALGNPDSVKKQHALVYVESYERPEEAIAREKQLKRWKRDWKIELIERENLDSRDLSDLLV